MSDQQLNPPVPPVKLAFIIDGTVLDVLHTDDRLAAIFLSEPLIIDISDKYEELTGGDPRNNLINWTFDGKNFNPPAPPEE